MAQPYDYSIDLPDPTQNLLGAIKVADAAKTMRANEAAATETKRRRAELRADLASAADTTSPAGIAKLMVKYPELSEDFKRTYDVLSTEQQKVRIGQAANAYAALESGDTAAATGILNEYAEAFENSGEDQNAKVLRDLSKMIELSPDTAKTSMGLFLAHAMGPDKFSQTFTGLQHERRDAELQSAKLTKAEAEANTAAVESKFAESEAVSSLLKEGWEVNKLAADTELAKQNKELVSLKIKLEKEKGEREQQKLDNEIADLELKRDEKVRTKAAELSSARANIDNSLSTIDRVLANPELENVIGSGEGGKFYPNLMMARANIFGGDADKRADAIADIETIQSQAFVNNLIEAKKSGATFGSLDKNEGEKLVSYVVNLKRAQSEQQFIDNLREVQRLLLKSRDNLSTQYGVPNNIPDRPNLVTSPEEQQGDVPSMSTEGFKVIGVRNR